MLVAIPSTMTNFFANTKTSLIKQFGPSTNTLFTGVYSTFIITLQSILAGIFLVQSSSTSRYTFTRFPRRRKFFNYTERPAFIKFIKFATR